MPSKLIDIHPHVISPDEKRYPRDPLGGILSDWARDRPITPDKMVLAMDEAGVSKAALVHASTCYGYDNRLVLDAVREYPDRFTGVFSVDVMKEDAPKQIARWVGEGLTCLRLFTTGSTMPNQAGWLDDPRTFPAWEAAGALNIPVCVQMRSPGIPQLRTLLERFPKVRIILDHLASPDNSDGPPYAAASAFFSLAAYQNLSLKFTILNVRMAAKAEANPQPFYQKVVDTFGSSRIAWGSNFPTSDASLVRIVEESKRALAFLPDEDQEWIFHKTAETLYPALAG